jgi:hypothetical protein
MEIPSIPAATGAFTTTGTNAAFGFGASRRANSVRHQ